MHNASIAGIMQWAFLLETGHTSPSNSASESAESEYGEYEMLS